MFHTKLLILLSLFIISSCSLTAQRDPYKWPFSQTSIWNMPIGSNATYVHAHIEAAEARGLTVDEDIIVLNPTADLVEIHTSLAGWNQEKDRCLKEGPLLFKAPIPKSFIVSPDTWAGLAPNSGMAVLMPDGITIKQTQPFAKCSPDEATSRYTMPDVSLTGDGIRGAHGGSMLSAIGGALRLGELDDPEDVIRHVLKVNLYADRNLFYDKETKGYRWPANRSDSYAESKYYTKRTNEIVKACRMGALLALPISMDIEGMELETIPAKILAKAFQHYGAYIVDDTAWDVYAIVAEWSPEGRFTDEFEESWGFSFVQGDLDTPWSRDIRKIFTNLHVVDNNGPENIGGGGDPLMPLAPPFKVDSPDPGNGGARIQIKTFLEGLWDNESAIMKSNLNQAGLLPLYQPFDKTPFDYKGNEQTDNIPSNIVDWVMIELRDANDPNQIIQQRAAWLGEDGLIYDTDGDKGAIFEGLEKEQYYISVHARGHLAVISSEPVNVQQAMNPYDFTQSIEKAKGSKQLKLVNDAYMLYAGDFDGNGIINNQDFNLWKSNGAALSQYLAVDVDGNGIVNNQDINYWTQNKSKLSELSFQ